MKNELVLQYFQKKALLTVENKKYKKIVDELLLWLFANDEVDHDITSNLLFETEKTVNARIINKEKMTVAGLEELSYLLETFTDINYQLLYADGDAVEANQIIVELKGEIKQILAFERIILNILQRMSGIATETFRLVSKIDGEKPFIAATRKTPWGLLDKKAVALGGGLTHRLDLADKILVKDNHLLILSAGEALQKLLEKTKNTLIEIEVEDEKTLQHLITVFKATVTTDTLAILLDNFSPQDVKKILENLKPQANIIFEASGGITKDNLTDWAKTGVDILSLGELTHSAKAADLSLELL